MRTEYLFQQCQQFSELFKACRIRLAGVQTDAELVAAIGQVLKFEHVGNAVHKLTMIKNVADRRFNLTDRLALRAMLEGDTERAARIWRRNFTEGANVDSNTSAGAGAGNTSRTGSL
jgi:hypothetical protein